MLTIDFAAFTARVRRTVFLSMIECGSRRGMQFLEVCHVCPNPGPGLFRQETLVGAHYLDDQQPVVLVKMPEQPIAQLFCGLLGRDQPSGIEVVPPA